MKTKFYVVSGLLLSLAAHALENPLSDRLRKTLGGFAPKASLAVRDAQGKLIAGWREDEGLAPASVAKLLSTGCALLELQPSFRFRTEFAFTGKVQGDVLDGDVVIKGGGDPSFVIEDLREAVEKLRALHGIREIKGKLLFDASYFGMPALPVEDNDDFKGDTGRSFAAPLMAAPFNHASFSAWAVNDPRGQGTLAVLLPAGTTGVTLKNHTQRGASPSLGVSYEPAQGKITLNGKAGAEPKAMYRAVPDPYAYFFAAFARTWNEQGGVWHKPAFELRNSSPKATLLYTHESRPLGQLLMDINKSSLNFAAELTLLAAGAQRHSPPATRAKALKVLDECFADLKVPAAGLKLKNASGLSRESQVRSSALTEFLQRYRSQPFAEEYLASLSLLGVDGTARSKLGRLAGRARLKTGTLRDVRGVAGYLYPVQGEGPLSFALFFNGVSPSDAELLAAEAKVLSTLIDGK